jgi:hypothetical protein
MILSGLQVAASLVHSSGSGPAAAQRGLGRVRADIHTDVIRRGISHGWRLRTTPTRPTKGVKSRTAATGAIL